MSSQRNSVSSTSSSLRSTLSSIKSMASEHHKSVNGAYSMLHGGPRPYDSKPGMQLKANNQVVRSVSAASSQKSSSSSTRRLSSAWESVKKAAREHHQGVNAAYASYYAAGVKA